MPYCRSKRSNATPSLDTNAQLGTLRSQVTCLEAMVGFFEMFLVKYGIPPLTEVQTAPGMWIAHTTTQ